jgi:hypothetical protein
VLYLVLFLLVVSSDLLALFLYRVWKRVLLDREDGQEHEKGADLFQEMHKRFV